MTKKPPADPKTVTPLDRAIAKRIRDARLQKNVGQVALADAIGVTFQQVQKYEKGTNRISASRLYQISQALETPIASFFGE